MDSLSSYSLPSQCFSRCAAANQAVIDLRSCAIASIRFGRLVLEMADLLFGVETEYAIAGPSPGGEISRGGDPATSWRTRQPGNSLTCKTSTLAGGVFLQNGSRFYVGLWFSSRNVHAQNATILGMSCAISKRGIGFLASLALTIESRSRPGSEIMCFRSNVDLSGSLTTWGCHRVILAPHFCRRTAAPNHPSLPIVTRLIYTGAGGFDPFCPGMKFTLSPRVAHLRQVVSESSTSDRGIFHTREESLCDGYSRLHVLCRESNCSRTRCFSEDRSNSANRCDAGGGRRPHAWQRCLTGRASSSMQEVAGNVTCKKLLAMADGTRKGATTIQRHYLELAEANVGASFMPDWAADVCRRWRAILRSELENAPRSVDQSLDWGIKLALYSKQIHNLGIPWDELRFWNDVIEQVINILIYQRPQGKERSLWIMP